MYWLGPAYGEHELEHAEGGLRGESPRLAYGGPYCDSFDEVCNYEIEVVTSRDRTVSTEGVVPGERYPVCWRRVRRAVVFGCAARGAVEKHVFTGSVLVTVSADSPFRVAEALRTMSGGRGLATPRPLSCREARSLSADVRRSLPRALRGCAQG